MRSNDVYNAVLNCVGQNRSEAVPILDIVRYGFRVGTVRAALKQAINRSIVRRIWDGNGR